MSDIGINDAGDLVLGQPVVDDNGEVILEGDKPLLDFSLKYDMAERRQMVYERLMTEKYDWYIYQILGNTLSDLIGQPNTRETADRGMDIITKALTYDALFLPNQIAVKAIPVNPEEIVFITRIQVSMNNDFEFYTILNVNKGVEVDVDYLG